MKNFFLTCKECILENPRNFYGCFYLGPFNSSQSLTVANGLRRTLLSEIPGLGIQSIEIEGVEHEFCNFLGLRESILDLLLNFKEIVLKYNCSNAENKVFGDSLNSKKNPLNTASNIFSKKPIYGYLQARGPGIIRASDLKLPPSIVCVDPNQYVGTLTTDGVLNLRFTICEGFTSMQKSTDGFHSINKELITEDFAWFTNKKDQPLNLDTEDFMKTSLPLLLQSEEKIKDFQTQNKKKFKKSKILWLDPIFTPILTVNYVIESFGSLELNGVNQVILLELWTNGSLHPRDALYKALGELNTMFSKLEKMKILNSIFAKTFLNSNRFYSKMLKKVKYNYGYYKTNASNPNQNMLFPSINMPEVLSSTHSQTPSDSFKDLGIEYLGLPFRIKNCLINANLLTIDNLLNCRMEDLKKISGMGNQSFLILLKKLNEKGLKLKN